MFKRLSLRGFMLPSEAHPRSVKESARVFAFGALPIAARIYVAVVIAAGAYFVAVLSPREFPRSWAFLALLVLSCVTSVWKVRLPLAPASGSTLSVSYAADLMALLLLGPREALIVALGGAWMQCTLNVNAPTPPYRTAFSMAAEAITMAATAGVYAALGGAPEPLYLVAATKPLVGAIGTYFFVNTGLVAVAIALSSTQPVWKVWHDNFLWSAPSFIVAGGAGAWAAVTIQRGDHWVAILMLAPVYLTYRTYEVFLGRIRDQQRHVEETRALHHDAVNALLQARRAEHALAEEKERLAVTLRSVGDGVIATDLNGTIVLLNSAAEALTGWTQADAVGRPVDEVFRKLHSETREPCHHSTDAVAPTDVRGLTRCTLLVARDLTERPIEERAAPLRDGSGRAIGTVIAFRDLSDAIKAEEERARAGKIASLGLLAGGIAHDFNNILMAIMGNVSMARVESPAGGAAARFLSEAEKACANARQLTWQLLTFSKGGVPIKKTIAVPRLLTEAAGLALRGSNVDATFDIAPDLWAINADGAQLVGVFHNILINARQAMPQGGCVEIHAENVFETESRFENALQVVPGAYVRVSIVDKGAGIAEENLSKIFDPYFTTKGAGSGLGLATSYSIIKNHGGYVSVDSKVSRGTVMRVHIPALSVHHIEEPLETAVPPRKVSASRVARPKGRVLIMDDEASVRTMAVSMLESLGYAAEVAESGSTAIERYTRAMLDGRRFDAVILDLVVPGGMGGPETFDRLEQIDPTVKAILASGYAPDESLAKKGERRFTAVITKPFTLEELNRTLYTTHSASAYHVH